MTTPSLRILLLSILLLLPAAGLAAPPPPTEEQRAEWRQMQQNYDYTAIATAYADYMIEHGRDRYGKVQSPLFVSVLDRKTGETLRPPYPHVIAKPYAPGLRRDHKMRPQDRTYNGGNPLEDLPLYGLLYRLSELKQNPKYAAEADQSIAWFLAHAQSKTTGLFAWGSHMYWDVRQDLPVYGSNSKPSGGYGGHEYNFVWPYWEQNPEALRRFAHGLWNHQITNKKTGHFSRHTRYERHGPENGGGFEFPETGSCYMDIWAREYQRSGDPEMKRAIQTLLKLFRSMRHPETGAMAWCTLAGADRREVANLHMNLSMATTLQDAADFVAERDPELAEEIRLFVRQIDDEYLSNDYDKILDVPGKGMLGWYSVADRVCMPKGLTPPPKGIDGSIGYPLTTADGRPAASLYYLTPWFPGRAYAGMALLLRDRYERCEEKHQTTYRRALLDVADIYMTIEPEVQFVLYPDTISDVVELLRNVYTITGNVAYLRRADQIMQRGVRLFFDDTSPLPKISNFDDWYESSQKNQSSVDILRQMLELSLDLAALPQVERTAPAVNTAATWAAPEISVAGNGAADEFAAAFEQGAKAGLAGSWAGDDLARPSSDVLLRYGPQGRGLYLSQTAGTFTPGGLPAAAWDIRISDAINHFPNAAEADKINGRMSKFTGKGFTEDHIEYAGYKEVLRQVAVVIVNQGQAANLVRLRATLHDTYHDNGSESCQRQLAPGEQGLFILNAPALKWIRRLEIAGDQEQGKLRITRLAFVMAPRNRLAAEAAELVPTAAQTPARPAVVFLIAGQSNATGVALLSPKHSKVCDKHVALPGSTAQENGIPITREDYSRSFIWQPDQKQFAPLTPGGNLLGGYNDRRRHGIELPLAWRLQQVYPEHDVYLIKYAVSGSNLHQQWSPAAKGLYGRFHQCLRLGMREVRQRHEDVQLLGLYWDQGESDRPQAVAYEKNLTAIVAAFRRDAGDPSLPIFLRKHLFQHGIEAFAPIIAAQQQVAQRDPAVHLLDLDLGSNEANFKAWAWTDQTGHLSSKAYLELTDRMLAALQLKPVL